MIEAIFQAVTYVFSPGILLWVFIGVIIGLIVGILPGLGITASLAILMPVVYGLNPTFGLTFLIAIYAAGSQGGSATSILFGVPGETTSVATMLDGYPMAREGRAGRALGISQMSSAMGTVFGGAVLALLIPIARPIVLAFGSPEMFVMSLLGISFVAVLGKGSAVKAIITGCLGIVTAFIGMHAVTGALRYTGGYLYLFNGLQMVPVFMGLFAIPEVIDLVVRGGTIAPPNQAAVGWSDVLGGVRDVFKHWSLMLRCSAIGTALGLVPGVGVVVSQFICYGHAKQTSKHPERFGQGCAEGLIAPESGNNAKEEGSLFTALAFGLPSGAPMAIILGALMVLGIRPGPEMITDHLGLFWTLVIALIAGNIIASGICLVAAKAMARITFIRGTVLVPIIILLVILGAYGTNSDIKDVVVAFIFGGFGYLMRLFDYSRVTFAVGFVLGDYVERYFLMSVSNLGPGFLLTSPIAIGLLAVMVIGLTGRGVKRMSKRFFRGLREAEE